MSFNKLIVQSGTTPTLTWAAIKNATNYRVQVANNQTFAAGTIVQDTTLGSTTTSLTLNSLGQPQKYFWRFKAYVGSWQLWQPMRSFYVNTGLNADFTPTKTGWLFVNPADTTDFYLMAVPPNYEIDHIHSRRSAVKNIAGDQLTEYVSTRDYLTLTFGSAAKNATGDAYIDWQQLAELMRFFHLRTSIYIIGVRSYVQDNFEDIWICDFDQQPDITPLAPGREDLYNVVLSLWESVIQ